MKRSIIAVAGLVALAGLFPAVNGSWLRTVPAAAQEPSSPARPEDRPAAGDVAIPRPSWKVGDTWDVESETDAIQRRGGNVAAGSPLRWRFVVAAAEPLAGRGCFRIEVECLTPSRVRPRSTLWVDVKTLMLREIRTQLAAGGQLRTIRESYDSTSGRGTPVITPINALPVDLPAFLPAGAKGPDEFVYLSQSAAAGAKLDGLVRFAHSVRQQVGPADAKALREVPESFAKDLGTRPVVAVKLAGPEREVTQLWQAGRPWPVFTNNGRTRARLVAVAPRQ